MSVARGTVERFRDLIHQRLLPGLATLGFTEGRPGSVAAAGVHGVVWLLDLDVAPWSAPDRVCFTVTWGVHVPGLDEVLGDPPPVSPEVANCVIHGRLGQRRGLLDPRWFELRSSLRPLARLADIAVTNHVLTAVADEVLPSLRRLSTPVEVQAHLFAHLETARGAPSTSELRTIRRIAALSLLLGDRGNAARWLDHLEARSAAAMAPDLVAERLAPLRERLAS